jgi:hypothetical protein
MSHISKLRMTLALALAPTVGLRAGAAIACYNTCLGTPGHKVCGEAPAASGWTQCVVPDGSHCEYSGVICFG